MTSGQVPATLPLVPTPDDTIKTWVVGKSTVLMWLNSRGLVYSAVDGFFSADVITPFIAELDRHAADHVITIFSDWSAMTGYAPETRKQLTVWQKTNDARVTETHLCVKSAIVSLGVNAANVVLGGRLTVTSNREKFYTDFQSRATPADARHIDALQSGDLSLFTVLKQSSTRGAQS